MTRFVNRHYMSGCLVIETLAVLFDLLVLVPAGAPFSVMLLALAGPALLWMALYLWTLRKESRQVLNSLEEDCDPEPILRFSLEMLAALDKKGNKRRPMELSLRLNAMTAQFALGLDGEAMETLDRLEPLLPRRPGVYNVVYCINRAGLLLLRPERRDQAAALLDRAEELMGTVKMKREQRLLCENALEMGRLATRLHGEEDLKGAEKSYLALLEKVGTQRQKVTAHMALGKCRVKLGEWDRAREDLAYVVEHGNKLYARCEAETLLAELAQGRADGQRGLSAAFR